MVLDAACGRTPAYVDTGLNLVHVDDVAQGHLLAFERGVVGERYILGGRNMTLQEILTEVARISGHKPPRVKLPHNLVLPIAYLSEAWAWLTNGPEPRATVDGVRLSKKYMFFSIEKARRELGFNPRPVEEALKDAVEWFRANGYCG
jgi:dihydroflavonol-4-reductase